MATTVKLALYYPDATTDGTLNFNTDTMLKNNWITLDNLFHESTGHDHSGAAGKGPKLTSLSLAAGAGTDTVIGNRTINDTIAAGTGADSLTNLLSKIGYMLKQVTGKGFWYTSPLTNLETMGTQVNAATDAATVSTIMKRDTAGRAKVVDPIAAGDIANMGWVNAQVATAKQYAP